MRAIWSGAISFGLVNIPVKLYTGVEAEEGLDLRMLSKKDMSPIRYARISTATNEEVEWKDIVKGYEVEKGKYVVITDEDFKKASPEKTNTIDIVQFSDESEIDPMFYEKPYYLVPDKGAAKPYALLLKALEKVKKVAIATCVIRNREHIFSLKPLEGNLLLMEQMRYVDEIKERPEVKDTTSAKITQQEISLAIKLIEQLTEKFEPDKFKDTYIRELKKLAEAKASGKKITAPSEKKPAAVKDLMSVLKQSLEATPHKKKKVA